MRSAFYGSVLALAAIGLGFSVTVACDNSSGTYDTEIRDRSLEPQIVDMTGPSGGSVRCHPAETGGNCPLPIKVTFRLKEGHFVSKAIVTFQGDGSDVGVDRYYAVPYVYGQGGTEVTLDIAADIPTTILRQNALFTYTVRLVTGAGAESAVSTLTISVT